jgi:lysophospholipase L1-like esterase
MERIENTTIYRAKKLLINLGLVLGALFLVFLILETGFRLMENHTRSAHSKTAQETWAIYDDELGYRLRPNYQDFNGDGLRDHPISREKGSFRILILGDSIPFYGDSIEDTYVGYLERQLNIDSESPSVEVINAGIKGYTNYQELIYLKKYGLRFEPDLVGISFCLNDLHKFLHQFEVKDGKIIGDTYQFTQEAVQSVDNFLYRLARKSHFLVWLRYKLSVFEKIIEMRTRDGFSFDYRPDFNTAWKEEPWLDIENQLQEMILLGRKNNFRLFLVAFPFGEQMRKDYLARDYNYVIKPQLKLKAICEKLDIAFLDLFNELHKEKHLLPDQIHLTREGRMFVAKRIATFLEQEGFVPF